MGWPKVIASPSARFGLHGRRSTSPTCCRILSTPWPQRIPLSR